MIFLNYISFGLILILAFKNLLKKDAKTYSVNKFLWVYIFIFWGVAPIIQYSLKTFPWNVTVTDSMVLKANCFILIWIITYAVFYKKFSKTKNPELYPNTLSQFKLRRFGVIFLISLQVGILIFFVAQQGFIVLLRSEAGGANLTRDSRPLYLIVDRVFRAITTFITLVLLMNYKSNKSYSRKFLLIISFSLLLLTNFPLAVPRYMAGAFYIAIAFVYKPNFKKRNTVIFGLLLLFLIVYPAFSVFRSLTDFSTFNYQGTSIQAFISGDFDNYSTLTMTIKYVEKNGITFGRQLLGVLLFFVPRSIWPDKPIGSGAFVAENRFMDFTNLSSPFIAEGYINFGIFGIILFAAILAYFAAKLDKKFYQYGKLTLIKLFYPVSLGLIFFILRGDLMSSFAYTISFVVAAFIVLMLVKPFLKYH